MIIKLTTLFLLLNITCAHAQESVYSDPNYPKPDSGYGTDGTHTVGVDSFPNPAFPTRSIIVYYPSDVNTPVPTIFYSHAFGGNIASGIDGMSYFVARKGYAFVFVPYQTIGVDVLQRYSNLLNGFQLAARKYTSIIDTTKVGFVGWSFGGGATYASAYTCFTQFNWGINGRFMYPMAPWYSYNVTQNQFQSFPKDVKLLTEIFDNDSTNDHRMAIDIFDNIGIPDSNKNFILLKSDTVNGYIYDANHSVPNTINVFNAFDYYAIYRLMDAMCDYVFNGNPAGRNVALGNGDSAQVTMPVGLRSLVEYSNPPVVYPESKYEYPCNDTLNERSSYCPQITATEVKSNPALVNEINIYPNPVTSILNIELPQNNATDDITIYNTLGILMLDEKMATFSRMNVDVSKFPPGIYFISISNYMKKFAVE